MKSVSNYGWRVDIERLRSKYFVDMMKGKDDGSQLPLPQTTTVIFGGLLFRMTIRGRCPPKQVAQ